MAPMNTQKQCKDTKKVSVMANKKYDKLIKLFVESSLIGVGLLLTLPVLYGLLKPLF